MKVGTKVIATLSVTFILTLQSGCKKESAAERSEDAEQLSIQMVQVMGGTFQMGSYDRRDHLAMRPHSVTLGGFSIDKTEITYEKWTDVRNWGLTHGYTDLVAGRNGYAGTTNHPVTEVGWYDVLKWCNARSERDGWTPAYYTSNTLSTVYRTGELDLSADAVKWTASGYRLPTEAEWEFAARGGIYSRGYAYSGSNNVDSVAWHYGNMRPSGTHPVATKGANELGIYDMSGNAMEWCWDPAGWYRDSTQTDPLGAPDSTSGSSRQLRGASFMNPDYNCRVAIRVNDYPHLRRYFIGFRCVRK